MGYVPYMRGRPSIVDQLYINNLLRPFYLKTYSILQTAKLTGCDRKTVKDRFNSWNAEAILQLNLEFKKGDTKYKVEYLNLIQSLIDEKLTRLEEIKSDINNARRNNDGTLPQLLAIEDKLLMSLQGLNEKRFAVKVEPGAEQVIERVLEDRIKRHVKSASHN